MNLSIITASHNRKILDANLMRSPDIKKFPLEVMEGFINISQAYNRSLSNKPRLYVHHDVFLPRSFSFNIMMQLRAMDKLDPDWGVLGVAGVKLVDGKKSFYGFINDRGKTIGSPNNLPIEVDTLDEVLLITKGDFVFDEQLPGTHFYGADICMQARLQGRKCYAINAYVHHNSLLGFGQRPPDFEPCKEYFRKKYIDHLPIATTCTIVI